MKSSPGYLEKWLTLLQDHCPLSLIFEKLWRSGDILGDWKRANVIPMCKKGPKEDLGNYRPISLTLIPRKVME